MATREELIQEAEQQWEREQLIKEAEAKYADEQESSSEMDEGAADDSAEVTGLQILEGLKQVTEAGAAPVRAGLAPVLANGLSAIPRGVAAMVEQIGEDADLAPTPMELAAIAGIPKDAKVPAPDLESGMAVSFTPEQVQGFLKQLGLGSGQATPSQVPAREVFATGVSQLDATPAIIGSLPTPAVKLPFRKQPLEILPAFEGSTGLLPQGLKAGAFGTAQAVRGAGAGAKALYKYGLKPAAIKATELGGAFIGSMRGLPSAVTTAKSAKAGAAMALKLMENMPAELRTMYDSLKPGIRRSFLKHYTTAVQNGIDPNLIMENPSLLYGKDSFITRAKLSMKSIGLDRMAENWNNLNSEISTALHNQVQELSIPKGTNLSLFNLPEVPTRASAGEAIRQAFNRKVSELFDQAKVRYSNVLDQSPKLRRAKLTEDAQITLFNQLVDIEQREAHVLKTSADDAVKAQAQANIRQIQTIVNSIADNDLATLIPQMQQLGNEAYTIKTVPGAALQFVSPQKQIKQSVHGMLQRAVMDTIESFDPAVAEQLRESNALQSRFFKQSQQISDVIADEIRKSPEKVYEALIAAGDTNKLRAVVELLGETPEFHHARGQFLQDLLRQDKEGSIIYNQVRKSLYLDKNKRILGALFKSETPTSAPELQRFYDLLEMGTDIGPGEFNPSGSGIVATLSAALSNPMEAIRSGSLGKAFIEQLEKDGIKRYLADMPLEQIEDVKKNLSIIYDRFGPEIDEVIKQRRADPAYVRAQKLLQRAKEYGSQDPIIGKKLEAEVIASTPDTTYSLTKKFLQDTFLDIGAGIDPGSTPLNSAYKTLLTIYNVNRSLGNEAEPMLIPVEDREMVKQVIRDSAMNSIQQTRNLRSLNNTGYLLNLEGLKKEPEAGGVIRKLMGPGAMASPKKDEALAADKAGPIDKLGRNPASPGLRAESSLNDEP